MNRNVTVITMLFFALAFYSPSCLYQGQLGQDSNNEFARFVAFTPRDEAPHLEQVYTESNIDSLPLPHISKRLKQSLSLQKKMLDMKRRGRTRFNVDGLKFTKEDLERTISQIEKYGSAAFVPLSEYFDTYQISGKDNRGSVLFTGYYSPVVSVRSKMDSIYRYPIYAKPKGGGPFPTRKQIYGEGALLGKGLELAYAKSLLDIQAMQLQGSGYVQYEDGSRYLFSYGGSNGHPRKSIQRYYQRNFAEKGQGVTLKTIEKFLREQPDKADEIIYHNPSYVFFVKNTQGKKVNGSGNVPLKPFISIATDTRYIPTGSCLIASRPIPRKGGIDYQMTMLLAQDVGGGIKGPGHVDLYTGVGQKGRKGTFLKDYGEMWLLLAK